MLHHVRTSRLLTVLVLKKVMNIMKWLAEVRTSTLTSLITNNLYSMLGRIQFQVIVNIRTERIFATLSAELATVVLCI